MKNPCGAADMMNWRVFEPCGRLRLSCGTSHAADGCRSSWRSCRAAAASIYGEINADLVVSVAVISEIIQSRPYEETPRRCQQSGHDTSHLTRLSPTPPWDDVWNSSVTPHPRHAVFYQENTKYYISSYSNMSTGQSEHTLSDCW